MTEFLVFSLLLLIGSYLYISYKEQTYINVLSFGMLIFIGANYILPLLYSYFMQPMVFSIGLFYVYVTYLVVTLVFMFSYHFHYALPMIKTRNIVSQYYSFKLKIIAIALLFFAWLIYAPILIHFQEYLLHPRAIYTTTRGGYGQYYFISLFFCIGEKVLVNSGYSVYIILS
jgi:hypothetical protein